MASAQASVPLADCSEAMGISLSSWPMSAVSNGRQGEPSGRLASACRRKKMAGELDAGNPHVQFDEGALETCDSVTRLCPTLPQPLAIISTDDRPLPVILSNVNHGSFAREARCNFATEIA